MLLFLCRIARSGNGYTNEYPVNRYLRDALLYKVGAGTMEIRRMLIGREFSEFSLLAYLGGLPEGQRTDQSLAIAADNDYANM